MTEQKERIIKLRREGKNYEEIGKILGMSKSTISYHIGKRTGREPKKPCKNCGQSVHSSQTYCNSICQKEWLDKKRVKNLKEGKLLTNNTIRRALIEEKGDRCQICSITSIWNNRSLTLHVDHIDGDSDNNMKNNVRLVCPNCHSQLDTSKSKVKKETKRNKYLRKYKGYENGPVV